MNIIPQNPILGQVNKYFCSEKLACYPFVAGTKNQALPHLAKRRLWWGEFKEQPPSLKELNILFSQPANVAIIGGSASDNLLVVDSDNRQQFEQMTELLAGYGIATWQAKSGTNDGHQGGGHFYLKTTQPVKTSVSSFGEIRSQGSYVLAPPSLHPGGTTYIWTNQSDSIFRLPRLDSIPELQLKPAVVIADMPRKARKLLQAEGLAGYKSRSEKEMAIICSLLARGYSYERILGIFESWEPAKFRESGMQWFDHSFQNAVAWLNSQNDPARQIARAAIAWAMGQSWTGTTARTDKAVYLAHCEIILQSSVDEGYHASVRELAELAGIHFNTVTKANKRLVEAGLIELTEKSMNDCPNRFRLRKAHICDTHSCLGGTECHKNEPFGLSHDLFRHRGLGKSGFEIYTNLVTMGDSTVNHLAQQTGISPATVKRKLATMTDLEIVIKPKRGWYRAIKDPDLDWLAEEVGTAGIGAKQKRQHKNDRRLYKMRSK